MKIQHLLYLHGFLSDGNSQKGQYIRTQMAEDLPQVKVHTVTYPVSLPDVSIGYLKAYIEQEILPHLKEEESWAIIGSSMGGLYAQYLAKDFDVPYIMINPALSPVETLADYQGNHIHPKTQENVTINERYLAQFEAYLPQLKPKENALLLLDRGDEVIPYQHAESLFQQRCKTLIFDQGDHAFQHLEEAWPHILYFLKR